MPNVRLAVARTVGVCQRVCLGRKSGARRWLQSQLFQQLGDITRDMGTVTSCVLVLDMSARSPLTTPTPRQLQQIPASHGNMTMKGKNRAFPAMRPFLLASKTFPRNSQAEFPLGPVGQGWVPDACRSQDRDKLGLGRGWGPGLLGLEANSLPLSGSRRQGCPRSILKKTVNLGLGDGSQTGEMKGRI